MNLLLILIGKFVAHVSHFLNLGNGSTWPGHIALSINKNFIREILKNSKVKIILVAGTNGKTTTGKLIQTILEKNGKKVFQNEGGANLLNGVATSLLLHSSELCALNYDFAIFEIDENTLPLILEEINNPDFVMILNLFRDQLDRYGEVNVIAKKWNESLKKLSSETTLILNADDPQIASLRLHPKGVNIKFFGLNAGDLVSKSKQHASDSTYCPECSSKLEYSSIFYSHLGIWKCSNCKNVRPKLDNDNAPMFPLVGVYNRYNTIAAASLASLLNISEKNISSAVENFKPAFGRQEILDINGRKVQIFLSKNPTSFNESLKTVVNLGGKNVLFVLNDRIPDGRDVSWIWDVDTEEYIKDFNSIIISGDRTYDMGLGIKYSYSSEFPISNFSRQLRDPSVAGQFPIDSQTSNLKFRIIENLKNAIDTALKITPENETLYILPTYSAMLEVRKILTGKTIL